MGAGAVPGHFPFAGAAFDGGDNLVRDGLMDIEAGLRGPERCGGCASARRMRCCDGHGASKRKKPAGCAGGWWVETGTGSVVAVVDERVGVGPWHLAAHIAEPVDEAESGREVKAAGAIDDGPPVAAR